MASFADKLARLSRLTLARSESVATAAGTTQLSKLRAQLGAVLGKSSAAPRSTSPAGQLSFVRCEGRLGSAHRRLAVEAVDRQVGRLGLQDALAADPTVLALLGFTPALADCAVERALFLDTETTGLGSGTGNYAFLVGMCWLEPSSRCWTLEQLLLRDPDDEPALLEIVRERVAAADFLVSYNGKSFDMPLLRARMVMNRLPELAERPHLDLLHVARRVHRARTWRKSLTTVEREVLAFDRGPDVHGEEVSACYRHYLRSGDETVLEAVAHHNAADVLSMVALLALYGEPLTWLCPEELPSVARALRRAGDLRRADQVAHRAVERGAGPEALRVRAEIAKARGDKARALEDFEAAAAELPDAALRLELAKLYEHYLKAPARALAVVEQGTGEDARASARRHARLTRKLERQARAAGAGAGAVQQDANNPDEDNRSDSGLAKEHSHPRPGWARVAAR